MFCMTYIHAQSSITIGKNSYITVGAGSNITSSNRNGSLRGTGTYNSIAIVYDPVAIAASSIAQTGFTANWNSVAGATGYRLDIATDANFTTFVTGYTNLDVGNVTSYTATNLLASTSYYYQVRAYDADCITASSNAISLITAPPNPVATGATLMTDLTFSANWNSVTGATGYRIDVATTTDFLAGTFVAGFENRDVGNVTTISVSGLVGNSNYYFRVRAYNVNGVSNNSNSITALTAPAAPLAINADTFTQTSFNAKWNSSLSATGYRLDVSLRADFSTFVTGYKDLDVSNVTSYIVNTNIAAGTNYYYRVRAYGIPGKSSNSNTITTITVPPNTVSTASTNITSTSFDINWNSSTGATGYYVDISTDASFTGGSFLVGFENKDAGNVNTLTVNTGITAGTTYYLRTRAYNANGTSGSSNTITTVTIPPAPVATSASSIAQTSFTANWNSSVGATKYYLDVSTSNTFTSLVTGWNNKDVGNVQTYSIATNINAGITYYYRVRAYNSNGTSGSSNVISIITVPADPTAAAASNISSATFTANWNSSTGATEYLLSVATDALFANAVAGWTDVNVGNVTTYNVNTNINSSTNYYYRVKAKNINGVSGYSGNIILLTAPAASVATAATTVTNSSFSANWNSVSGATGYYLDVSTNSNFTAGNFITGYNNLDVSNVTTYSVSSNLNAGITYYYRIRSYNSGGTSGNSNISSLETIPESPLEKPATLIASTSFTANWYSATGAAGYKIDVSTSSGFAAGSFVSGYENKDVGNVTSFDINTNLTEGTTYYYRIRSYNSGGASGNSGVKSLITLSLPPTANNATTVGPTKFTANWTSVSGATGYSLDVSTDNLFGSFFSGYNNLNTGNVTSFEVTGLSGGMVYYFRVRAFNGSGSSSNSNTKSVITLSPAPSTSAATVISSSGFTANWNSSTGALGYFLDVATDAAFTSLIAAYNNKDVGNVTSYSVTGLSAGTNYYYRTRANNASGQSYNSTSVLVTTIPPDPVELAASSITNNSFIANWNASSGVTGYYIDIATDNGFLGPVAGYNNKNIGNVTSYSITGLSANKDYYYRVRAYNSGGTSGNSGTISLTTTPNLVPVPSLNPASSVTSTSFRASWNASSGATKYYLDVSTVNDFSAYVSGWQNVDVANVLTYNVNTNITAGNIYYFRVRAYNSSGTSGNSNVIMVKTIPLPPVEQAASALSSSNFDANWNTSSGATGYYLDVATDVGFTSFVSGFNNRDLGNVNTFTVTGLTGGTAYHYRIRAYNTGGISTSSGTIDVRTSAGGTVIATAATSINGVSFTANWDAYPTATGYILDVSTSSTFAAGAFVTGFQNRNLGNATSYNVTGLTEGTLYYYRVIANDALAAILGTSGTINVITLPAAPVVSNATLVNEISFNANWNPSASATGYYLDVATNNTFTSFVTGFNNKYMNNVTTYTVTGLSGGITYYYRVRAKNGSGTGESSSSITTVTIPHEPTATYATALTKNSFNANWNLSTGSSGYKLDVSKFSNFSSIIAGYNNLDVNDVTSSVTGLESGTTYYYRIRAYNSNGTSGNSETIITQTVPDAPVSNSATSIGKTSFAANWNSAVGSIEYYLDVALTGSFNAGTYVSGYQNLNVGNSLTYNINGLSGGTQYFYRVRASNTSGTSTNSDVVTVVTLPPIPSILSASNVQSTSFTANWNSSLSATGYKLDVSTLSDFSSFVGVYNNLDVGDVSNSSVTGLTGGTTYYYRVRAYNANGSSENSNSMTVLIAPAVPVAAAASLITGTSFSANWNSSAGADGYKIDVATDAAFANIIALYNNKDAGIGTSYNITGLDFGQTYYYRVRSYSGTRTSGNSSSISVLTKPDAPATQDGISITSSSFIAKWNSSTGAAGYYLDVSTNNNFSSFISGFNNLDVSNVTTYSVIGLTANTNYFYRVRAYNNTGSSINSSIISLLTAPTAPIASAASSILNTSFTANWNSTSGATAYRLDVSSVSNFASFVGVYNNKDVGNVTNYSITGLSGSTDYYYRVRAYNGNSSSNSGTINLTTAVNPSGSPTAIAASNNSQTSFTANWNATAGAAGYYLDVSTDWNFGAGNFVANFENKDVGNVTNYSVTGLTSGTNYYYRLRSYNVSGTSGNSGSISTITSPSNPVSSSATSITTSEFTANWNSSSSSTGYYLDIATDDSFTSFVAGYNNKNVLNVTSYSLSSLSGGTAYYYRVRAYNDGGTSGNSSAITVITYPSAVTANNATSIAETAFDANWNSVTGATGYKLDVSTNIGFAAGNFLYGLENKDIGNVTTYSITGLTGGSNYYYRIRAYNTTGTGANSNSITTLTLSSSATATAATSVCENTFSANWTSVLGSTAYYLDVSTDAGFGIGTFVAGYQNRSVGNVTTFSVTGLTANTNYFYRVRAANASGASGNSNVITLLTSPFAPVANSATSLTQTGFKANWNAAAGASGYYLDVSSDPSFGSGTFETDYENRDVGNVTSFNVADIADETTHYYRVRAYNTGGTSSYSSSIKVLGVPFGNAATIINATSFTANWGSIPSAILGFRLDVSTDINFGAGTYLAGYQNKDVGIVNSYTITGLTPYVIYYYRIRSYDASMQSANSNTVIVRNLPQIPVANNATSISQNSFQANWNASLGASGYYLDVATDIAFTSLVSGYDNLGVPVITSNIISGLNSGTNYYYRIRAVNSSGTSGNSNIIATLTMPASPNALGATNITQTSFTANWNLCSGADSYFIDVSTDVNFNPIYIISSANNLNVGNVTNYTFRNLISGIQYFYRIRASNSSGISDNSNTVWLKLVSPNPIVRPATEVLGTSFMANWENSLGAEKYYVDVATNLSFNEFVIGYQNKDVGNTTSLLVNTNISEGTNYYYRIRAFNQSGTSGNSEILKVMTILSSPTSLAVSNIAQTSFKASWNQLIKATGYYLDVSTSPNFETGTYVPTFENRNVGNVTTWVINGLSGGTKYYVRVRAYNSNMISASSASLSGVTIPPDPIALAASNVSSTGFTANWNQSKGAVNYYLDVSLDNNYSSFVSGFENKEIGNITSVNLNFNFNGGTIFYYRVRAANESGISSSSQSITVLTFPNVPVALEGTLVTQSSFNANWNLLSGLLNGYYLDVATDPNFTNHVSGYNKKDVGKVSSFNVTGLLGGTIYYYRVRGYNNTGTSSYSASIKVTTIPLPPVIANPSGITTCSFTANWDASIGATGYQLDVATNEEFTEFVEGFANKDVGNITSINITTLSVGASYYYRIRSYNNSGSIGNSGIMQAVTLSNAPAAISVTNITRNSFTLSWNSCAGAKGYLIDISTDSNFLNCISGYANRDLFNCSSHDVNGITENTTYYVRIRSYNRINEPSTNTQIVVKSKLLDEPVFTSPPYSNITSNGFTIRWNSVAGAKGFYLDIATDLEFNQFIIKGEDINNTLTYSTQTLAPNVKYFVRIRAYNENGQSENSNVLKILTLLEKPKLSDAINITQTEFTINWNRIEGASGYKIDIAKDNLFTNYLNGYSGFDAGNVLSNTITGLANGTKYYIRIKAYNLENIGENSAIKELITLLETSPTDISTSFDTNGNIVLTWKYLGDVKLFYIYRDEAYENMKDSIGSSNRMDNRINFTLVDSVSGNARSYFDKKTAEGANYIYAIEAVSYNGARSGFLNLNNVISTVTIPPNAPSDLSGATLSDGNINLKWKNNSRIEEGFIIERSVNDNKTFIEIHRVASGVASYSDNQIVNGFKYYYRVLAFKGDVKSNYSNEIFIVGMVTDVKESEGLPTVFNLSQNYPNPFNPSTTIRFGIPEAGFVTLKVYNIIGEEVATLVNGNLNAGYHSTIFYAKDLASGTYIYRMNAGSNVKTYKMIIVK